MSLTLFDEHIAKFVKIFWFIKKKCWIFQDFYRNFKICKICLQKLIKFIYKSLFLILVTLRKFYVNLLNILFFQKILLNFEKVQLHFMSIFPNLLEFFYLLVKNRWIIFHKMLEKNEKLKKFINKVFINKKLTRILEKFTRF